MSEVNIRNECGATLITARDDAGTEHRYWCEETDAGRLIVASEVVQHDGQGRHYVDEITVPDRVREYVLQSGYEGLVDENGRKV